MWSEKLADFLDDETYWIAVDGERARIVRLFDLEDSMPMFDLRICQRHRGKGSGGRPGDAAVFRRCGYVKEAHYRRAWSDASGRHKHDSAGYAVLRQGWQTDAVTVPDLHDE